MHLAFVWRLSAHIAVCAHSCKISAFVKCRLRGHCHRWHMIVNQTNAPAVTGGITSTLSSCCTIMKMNCFVLVALAVVMTPALSYIPCNPIDLQLALISANYTGSVIAQTLLSAPMKTRYAGCFICSTSASLMDHKSKTY